jgi:hypothetical protein
MDQWEPAGAGLFRLRRDGAPTPVTSYVDRSLQRGAQTDQLQAGFSWLPEQVFAAAVEQIMEGTYSPPGEVRPVSGGRLFVPTPTKLTVLLAQGEAEAQNPLRQYLWPALDGGDGLVLGPGETLLHRRRTLTPTAMKCGAHARGHLTTHRIATIATQSLPTQQRGGQRKHRQWVHHVRYEWLTAVTKRVTKVREQLSGGWGPEHVTTTFIGKMRFPWGHSYSVAMWRCGDERIGSVREPEELGAEVAEFEQRLEQACRDRGLRWTLTGTTAREAAGGTQAEDIFTLDPDAAYSIPAALLGAPQARG